VTEVVNSAEGDPTVSLHPHPEPSVSNPLINVLQEVVVWIGLGEKLAKWLDFDLRIKGA
jgi:hypothetical protein